MLRQKILKLKSDTNRLARRLLGAISRSAFRRRRLDSDSEMANESTSSDDENAKKLKRISSFILERVKKIQELKPTKLGPSPRGQTPTQPGDDLDRSEKARDLWDKNDELIKALGRPLDSNKNETVQDNDHIDEPVGEVPTNSSNTPINISNLADEIFEELMNSMRNIFTIASTDPVFLRTCFEIIEVQRRKDEFAKEADHQEIQIQRPLQWDQKCLTELQQQLGTRLKPTLFNEENSAIFLQEIIQTLESNLKTIKNFVNEYQPNDDYVLQTVAEAYRSHIYNLMEGILQNEVNEVQLNSILIFHGDFRRKFPKSTFTDFWQEKEDGSTKLHIMPEDKYKELVKRYFEIQSKRIKEHLERGRRVEIEFWLSETKPHRNGQNVYITQWPVDVLDLCQEHLKVSQKIGPEVYYKMLSLLKQELENAIMLYAAGAKYYIQPEKHVLPNPRKHPEFEILRRRRGRASQDPPSCFNEYVIHAILNNFSLLNKHLSTLSDKYKDENRSEQFVTLQGVLRERAEECLKRYKQHVFQPSMEQYSKRLLTNDWWSADSPVTTQFCEKIQTYISCLDSTYFEEWFELVREKVHLVYLKAMCKRCQDMKCKTDEDRSTVVNRLEAEKKKIERTVKVALPCYENDFIELLAQAAAVVKCTDKESCSTEVYVLKARQQKIITAEHLKSILIINGSFKSKTQRKIIGALFRTDEVATLAEQRSNPICTEQAAADNSEGGTDESD